MSNDDIITHSDLTKVLTTGALLRDQDRVLLLQGPFHPSAPAERQGLSLCAPEFYETEKTGFLSPAREWSFSATEFARRCVRYLEEANEAPPSIAWNEPAKADFENAFVRIQNLIVQGQIDKAVPCVFARAEASVTPALRARWIAQLLEAPKNLHVHGFWDADEGLLGATPEILFEVNGKHLRTMALAGTLAKADGRAEDLARSTKDQAEHRIVVDDLRRVLSDLGTVEVGLTTVAELPTLYHLHTPIDVELHDRPDAQAIMHRLHPTPALGVAPRPFGWRWMRELPGQEGRARYGAPFLVRLSPDRALALVSIRNVQWKDSRLVLGSGCGIVRDSELDAEWNELSRKRESVRKILGLAQGHTS